MMTATFVPGIPMALVLAFIVWTLRREQLRRMGREKLAEKYDLKTNPRRQIAPDPDIRGVLMPAVSSRYMQGRIDGVPVVAFDYSIGWGRGRKSGSCAGVKRRDVQLLPPAFAPVFAHEGDWTFLHSDYSWWWRGRYLTAGEIEQLWDLLLHALGPNGVALENAEVSRGVVIRPAKPEPQ